MLIDDIKRRITQAMKERDEVTKNILRLAFGEMQTAEARSGRPVTDDEGLAIVRKLVKSNEETMALAGAEQADVLRKENAVLAQLLPATLSVAEIAEALVSQRDALRAAKNDGQATGLAMKHLKATGAAFDGTDVATAVKQLRA